MTGSDDRQRPATLSPVARSHAVTLALLAIPVAMIAAGLALLAPSLMRGFATSNPTPAPGVARNAAAGLSLADAVRMATPATPWRNLARDSVLTRIGFGSCLHQSYPQPIWTAVAASKPQLFLMMGDNVYGDIRSPDGRELAEAYRRQLANPEFSAVRATLPMLGTWDDHDYGLNDAAAAFPHRATASALFRAYWQRPAPTAPSDGIYSAHMFGTAGRRVQIIMLDTRSFRSAFAPKPDDLELFGKFGPDRDPSKTMLGATQWAWLEAELRKPAEVRLLVSSIQVLSDGHAFERWGNLPHERDRLIAMIENTGAKGVVLLSGDRHMGAIYNRPIAAGQLLIEITSSSLNRSYGPAKDVPTADLVSDLNHVENFGMIEIDWTARRLSLSLRGMGGQVLDAVSVRLADLGAAG